VVAAALGACSKSSAETFSGSQLHQVYKVPSTKLTDTEGRPVALDAHPDPCRSEWV